MSEFTWYSRLAVWVGAAILLVQAFLGRGTSFITLVAVVLLSVGFMAFLVGLVRDGGNQSQGSGQPSEPANVETSRPVKSDTGSPALDDAVGQSGDVGWDPGVHT